MLTKIDGMETVAAEAAALPLIAAVIAKLDPNDRVS